MIRLRILKQRDVRIPRTRIEKLFNRIMKTESVKGATGNINLVFTTDREIKKLNRLYGRKNKPTDVLSFNYDNQFGPAGVFGEIYISVETAVKQAKAYNHSLNREFFRLVCHGLLHLMGYDHIKTPDRKKMEAKEGLYLSSLGLT
ncbi:MAG TPA: rRNA maturation RNase YbeY [candidate division Zixibacteria bacterium]|nr:rRNA maturation RNase YbeY [candidate division Zixibacteria bacterium]